jgi:peroxiredoxin
MSFGIGEQAPSFELPDTEGRRWSADPAGAPAVVVVFTCNHCPYALAWHERISEVARDYAGRGVRVLAINSNDAERYPRDSLQAMRTRVRSEDWPMPYLHDAEQTVARAYDAETTPDVFILDAQRRLRYRGAPDGDYDDPGQRAQWMRSALDALLDGGEVEQPQTKPVGCSIKWKP